ncbi:MAG: PhnD/SsuA/transferrin family substrate-binding protein [Rhodospirillales bacterium]|jgi:phosphonate transport system substrate-binding protein
MPGFFRRRFAAGALALTCLAGAAAQGSELRFAVTDIVGLENLQREWGPFQKALKDLAGLDFRFFPVPNRTAAVEALNARRIDVVLTGPAEYVVFRARTNAVPVVGLTRVDYFSNIVVRADSPYNVPADLKGQKLGLGAIGSTSRHLGPIQILADQGMNPRADLQINHLSTNVLLEAVKRGDVAAGGMNNTDFQRLRDRNPDMAFRVIARGRDLPMDLILAGSHVDSRVLDALRTAFREHGSKLTQAILSGGDENQKFKGMHWITTIRDDDFNYVRRMYGTIGQPQFSEFVGD